MTETKKVPVVDVIIPVYRPDEKLIKLIDRLHRQTMPVRRILLITTRSEKDAVFYASADFERYGNVSNYYISREEFDHGGTRRRAVEMSDAPYFICMTDDALPLDCHLIEHMVAPLAAGEAVLSYARQLAPAGMDPVERYTRRFNYPAHSRVKSAEDLQTLGIKTFFCPDVCAAYDRSVYDRLGGFEKHIIFNEDMVYAHGVITAGYKIAYVAEARVLHAHEYSCMQQLHRNFDLGVSQSLYPKVFGGFASEGEGMRLVKDTAAYLLRNGEGRRIPNLLVKSACKYIGYRLGKMHKKLPAAVIRRLTMNQNYWEKKEKR